jgi:hypothetical protein
MSDWKTNVEPDPTPDNPLVVLTTKIENLIANEDVMLAMSALVSAILRTEAAIKYGGDQRQAAFGLARLFENIARKSEN